MIYLIFLFIYNLLVIILLSNVKPPSIHNLFEYKIVPTMKLRNSDVPFSELQIDKYHSLYSEILKDNNEDNNDDEKWLSKNS